MSAHAHRVLDELRGRLARGPLVGLVVRWSCDLFVGGAARLEGRGGTGGGVERVALAPVLLVLLGSALREVAVPLADDDVANALDVLLVGPLAAVLAQQLDDLASHRAALGLAVAVAVAADGERLLRPAPLLELAGPDGRIAPTSMTSSRATGTSSRRTALASWSAPRRSERPAGHREGRRPAQQRGHDRAQFPHRPAGLVTATTTPALPQLLTAAARR